jgi:hypothetical protein
MQHIMIHTLFYCFCIEYCFSLLLYKLYTYTRRWTTIWFCKKEIPTPSADVSYAVERGDRESTVNINIRNSNDSLSVADATPQSPKRTLRPRVAKSYF